MMYGVCNFSMSLIEYCLKCQNIEINLMYNKRLVKSIMVYQPKGILRSYHRKMGKISMHEHLRYILWCEESKVHQGVYSTVSFMLKCDKIRGQVFKN